MTTENTRIVIDDGTKEYELVNQFGKPICKIHFRPADFSILDRYNDFVKDFEAVIEPLKGIGVNSDGTAQFGEDWEKLKSVEAEVKNRFNHLFDMDEADDIFKTRNPFSSVSGRFFCARVLDAIGQIITEAINKEAELSKKRTAKYLTKENPDVRGASENA